MNKKLEEKEIKIRTVPEVPDQDPIEQQDYVRIGHPEKNDRFLIQDLDKKHVVGGTDDSGQTWGKQYHIRDENNQWVLLKTYIKDVIKNEGKISPENILSGSLSKDIKLVLSDNEKRSTIVDGSKGIIVKNKMIKWDVVQTHEIKLGDFVNGSESWKWWNESKWWNLDSDIINGDSRIRIEMPDYSIASDTESTYARMWITVKSKNPDHQENSIPIRIWDVIPAIEYQHFNKQNITLIENYDEDLKLKRGTNYKFLVHWEGEKRYGNKYSQFQLKSDYKNAAVKIIVEKGHDKKDTPTPPPPPDEGKKLVYSVYDKIINKFVTFNAHNSSPIRTVDVVDEDLECTSDYKYYYSIDIELKTKISNANNPYGKRVTITTYSSNEEGEQNILTTIDDTITAREDKTVEATNKQTDFLLPISFSNNKKKAKYYPLKLDIDIKALPAASYSISFDSAITIKKLEIYAKKSHWDDIPDEGNKIIKKEINNGAK